MLPIITPEWRALVHISCSAEKNRGGWHTDKEINDIPKKEKEFNANKLIIFFRKKLINTK